MCQGCWIRCKLSCSMKSSPYVAKGGDYQYFESHYLGVWMSRRCPNVIILVQCEKAHCYMYLQIYTHFLKVRQEGGNGPRTMSRWCSFCVLLVGFMFLEEILLSSLDSTLINLKQKFGAQVLYVDHEIVSHFVVFTSLRVFHVKFVVLYRAK